jgi:hypothetical protein
MKKVAIHARTYWLIYLGLAVYLLFFISVAWTGWLDIFFSGAAAHAGDKGVDFYQILRGTWAYQHGGSLTGEPLPNGAQYANQNYVNDNVYHPLFTFTLGSLLLHFNPDVSPYVWLWTKFVLSLPVIAYFYWSFRQNKYAQFAVFVILVNFSVYLELTTWQFQFVFNILLLVLLVNLIKKGSFLWNGATYGLGLFVKPIGLLLVPVLFFRRQWKVALVGIGIFALTTWIMSGPGKYYIDNLTANLFSISLNGPNQIISFNAFLRYITTWDDSVYREIQNAALALLVVLGLFRRVHLSKAVFLLIVYYLCFYNQVYEYQWSTLAYVIAVCIVCCPEFQTKLAIIFILLNCLPTCFLILNLLHIDVTYAGTYGGWVPGATAWEWMVVSKFVPLFLLCGSVLASDVKPIFKQLKTFVIELRKVNKSLRVFGEEDDGTAVQPEPVPPQAELVSVGE